MPNKPKTPMRTVRIDDVLWRAVQGKAAEEGVSVSDVIRRALARYAKQKHA